MILEDSEAKRGPTKDCAVVNDGIDEGGSAGAGPESGKLMFVLLGLALFGKRRVQNVWPPGTIDSS